MATTASTRAAPPASRRSSSVSSTQPPSSIARGATARSAVSPRVSSSLTPPARRASLKGATPPSVTPNGDTRESLSASLKQEMEKKEQLLVQLQDRDQTITTLKTDNGSLQSSLNAAETRLAELYADQGRMEEEMAARIEVAEKLRSQVRELEKEKRDIQRRYNEQTSTFEAERQAFYDNEQHLKSRIQSLSQARKQPVVIPHSPSLLSVVPSVVESLAQTETEEVNQDATQSKQDISDPEQEPAEMTALRLELSTLSTSYNSLQSTLQLLQSQLIDLKRVNNELQEENESYNILLRERTLNGQFDVLKMGGTSISEASSGDEEEAEDNRDSESLLSRNTGRSSRLDRVDELAEEQELEAELGAEPELDPSFKDHSFRDSPQSPEPEQEEESQARNARSRHSRKRSSVSAPHGESLANLPITGPGLDLAAELGRAENKDILEGRTALDNDRSIVNSKSRKNKKGAESNRKVSSNSEPGLENNIADSDLVALRNEVKSLKDANKALSLYASKIIDRIISQEGFEHVLAVDFDKNSPTTPQNQQQFTTFASLPKSPPPANPPQKKARPQSVFASFTSSTAPATPTLPQERLTTFSSPSTAASSPQSTASSPPTAPASTRASRRSMSFDWKSFSMFGGGEKKPDPPANLRPLTLKAGAGPIVTGARKLDNQEDDEDRRERERLNATMKLMGIEKPLASPVPASPSLWKSFSSPGQQPPTPVPVTATNSTPVTATGPPPPSSRFSFFRRSASTSTSNSENSSLNNSPRPPASGFNTPNLTQEALERAEAENALAALDAQEKQLSAEMAKGAGGGFTEITRRSGDRRSSRRSGSGSTVWSAGMSRDDD